MMETQQRPKQARATRIDESDPRFRWIVPTTLIALTIITALLFGASIAVLLGIF